MKPLLLFSLACLATSCREQPARSTEGAPATAAKPAAGYCLPASTAWAEDDFTQWMTRAELLHFQGQTPSDQYFAHIEGRNNGGLNEYRAVRKPMPSEQYAESAVFWSLDEKELFDRELRLLRTGFVRKSMQVFVDASGTALHQIVWLKPLGASGTVAAAAAPATASAPDPLDPDLPDPDLSDSEMPDPEPSESLAGSEPSDAGTRPAASGDPSPLAEKPPVARVVPQSEQQGSPEPEPPNAQKFTTYTVVKGDILDKIARRQHTTIDAIMAANDLDSDKLSIGQKLKIPKTAK
jgi:nucleoid-associated protein YgaU